MAGGIGGRSRTGARNIARMDDMSRALDLKRRGKSIRQIAAELGVSPAKAHQLVEAGIKSIPAATRDALVAEIHERELGIIATHWPTRKDPDSAKVIQASDKLLVDLLGLAAPKRQELTGADGAPLIGQATPAEAARLVREAFGEHGAKAQEADDGPTPEVPPDAPTE